jgi:exodeoxyribonuclease VII large subunit
MASFPLFDALQPVKPAADHWTVSELTGRIQGLLQAEFGALALVGEIANLSRPASGHLYFNLKDAGASIRAVMWRSAAAGLKFRLENGLAVRVRGELAVYAPRGDYQIQVRSVVPEGIGALELAFRQLSERLEAEGLFAPERKRPLPEIPMRIVLVTSPTGAAIRDFLRIAGRRWPAAEILVAPSRVQGEGADAELCAALELANRVTGADLVILARGGGSLEDLWSFNSEHLARAIAASRLPVVSAVGHETDVTIADRVADFRAATPSEAAERCLPDGDEVGQALDALARRLDRAGRRPIAVAREELDRAGRALDRAMRGDLERRSRGLLHAAARLEALSPLAVLTRGYSLTLDGETGHVVSDAGSLATGQLVTTRLARGSFVSRVEAVQT